MDKLRKSRKAQGFTEIFSGILIFMTAIVFYFFLFKLPGCSGDIPEQKLASVDLSQLRDQYNLMSLLRSPVYLDGQEIMFSELIGLSFIDGNYSALVKNKLALFLNETEYECAAFCMKPEKGSIKRIVFGYSYCFGSSWCSKCSTEMQYIPYLDSRIGVGLEIAEKADLSCEDILMI